MYLSYITIAYCIKFSIRLYADLYNSIPDQIFLMLGTVKQISGWSLCLMIPGCFKLAQILLLKTIWIHGPVRVVAVLVASASSH